MNFSYVCVPFGKRFSIYSAPMIANKNDFGFLLRVEKKIFPSGFNNFAQVATTEDG